MSRLFPTVWSPMLRPFSALSGSDCCGPRFCSPRLYCRNLSPHPGLFGPASRVTSPQRKTGCANRRLCVESLTVRPCEEKDGKGIAKSSVFSRGLRSWRTRSAGPAIMPPTPAHTAVRALRTSCQRSPPLLLVSRQGAPGVAWADTRESGGLIQCHVLRSQGAHGFGSMNGATHVSPQPRLP